MATTIYQFEEVFDTAPNGVPILKRALSISGWLLPPGTPCQSGLQFGGTEISKHLDQPLIVFDREQYLEFLGFASFSKDKANKKWVMGWGVVKNNPWCLFDFLPTKEQADEACQKAGVDFDVVYGSKRIGSSDDFIGA